MKVLSSELAITWFCVSVGKTEKARPRVISGGRSAKARLAKKSGQPVEGGLGGLDGDRFWGGRSRLEEKGGVLRGPLIVKKESEEPQFRGGGVLASTSHEKRDETWGKSSKSRNEGKKSVPLLKRGKSYE